MAVLVITLLATAMMAGLSWFISVVHYPLFALVGPPEWRGYHAAHTSRTTWVVVVPMVVELLGSALLVFHRPDGVGAAPVLAGLAAALGAWSVTFAYSVGDHGRLADGYDRSVGQRLVRYHHVRTALWSAHAVGLCVLVLMAA